MMKLPSFHFLPALLGLWLTAATAGAQLLLAQAGESSQPNLGTPPPASDAGSMIKPDLAVRGVENPPPAPAPTPAPAPPAPPEVTEATGAAPLDPGKALDVADPAAAAAPPSADQAIASTPTGNVVINLINKLVERGVLTKDDAQGMVSQAQAEAEVQS